MGQNFIESEREQMFLLPQDIRKWLPDDDICWFVIESVESMDLAPFYSSYRQDGTGRAAYDPKMMLTLVLYSYMMGERSSRKIEKLCRRDISFRVITGNLTPDHTTICRFRKENSDKLESLFIEVLRLCVKGDIVNPNVVAVDGTRIKANASMDRNVVIDEQIEKVVKGWLDEAEKIDAEEDELYGQDNPGCKLPEKLSDPEKRKKFLNEYFERKREGEQAEKKQAEVVKRRKAEQKRTGKKKGPRIKSPSEARAKVDGKSKKINTTDPESRIMKGPHGHLQGYNAQIAVTKDQVIMAAELYKESSDAQLLHPVLESAKRNASQAGCATRIEDAVADAGYMSEDNLIRENTSENGKEKEGPRLFIATKKDRYLARELKETPIIDEPLDESELTALEKMTARHMSARGRELFKLRATTVEPVFGQIKEGRRCRRFMLRGIDACRGELMLFCAAHNLLKMFTLQASGKEKPR